MMKIAQIRGDDITLAKTVALELGFAVRRVGNDDSLEFWKDGEKLITILPDEETFAAGVHKRNGLTSAVSGETFTSCLARAVMKWGEYVVESTAITLMLERRSR